MTSAVIARVSALLIGAGLFGTTVLAEPVEELVACRAIEEDAARLACFDALADRLAVGPETPAASVSEPLADSPEVESPPLAQAPSVIVPPSASPVVEKTPEQSAVDAFGGDRLAKTKDDKPKKLTEISTKVADLQFTSLKKAIVTLENGQVWRQLDSDSTRVRKKTAIGAEVTIKKASFGSHKMKIDGGRSFRVKRVR